MDESQAEGIANAILEPDLKGRETLQIKKSERARSLAERRKVTWFSPSGFVIGIAVAYLAVHRSSSGVFWRGIAGTIVGWVFISWRRRRYAS